MCDGIMPAEDALTLKGSQTLESKSTLSGNMDQTKSADNSLVLRNVPPKAHTADMTLTVKNDATRISNPSPNGNSTTEPDLNAMGDSLPISLNFYASFHRICIFTAILPLFTLLICFITAYVFQYDDVHETHCRVYNVVPSISAITGVSPQRYFWRFSIALHIGPRLPIAFIYKNHYRSLLVKLMEHSPNQVPITNIMITAILILNCIEVLSLGGVTYISNRENYPIHEKIFITFMVCSLLHMLITLKLHQILHCDLTNLTQQQRESIKWKKLLFIISILSTIGLLIFFAKHRFYCHDLAFSWFAFFEYVIAIANMLFHFTIIWDFPSMSMLIVQGTRKDIEKLFSQQQKKFT